MRKHVPEDQLALYVSRDLPPAESTAVAGHLEECADCQIALEEFRRADSLMGEWLKDPVLEDLVAVRARVAAKLGRGRSLNRPWAWCCAGAAAALVLLIPAVHVRPRLPVTRPEAPLIAQRLRQEAPPAGPKTSVAHHRVMAKRPRRREAGLRTVTLLAGANQPSAIKMTTRDPNVVILWQLNERTEDQ